MTDLSMGERIVLRLRLFIEAVGSRPALFVGTVVAVGLVAEMTASLSGASAESFGSYTNWILLAAGGFGLPTQLGLAVVTVLVLIDGLSGGVCAPQRALFAALVVVGGAGVAVNLVAMVSQLSEAGLHQVPVGTLAEARTIVIANYLAPAMLAALVCWLGFTSPQRVRTYQTDPQ